MYMKLNKTHATVCHDMSYGRGRGAVFMLLVIVLVDGSLFKAAFAMDLAVLVILPVLGLAKSASSSSVQATGAAI